MTTNPGSSPDLATPRPIGGFWVADQRTEDDVPIWGPDGDQIAQALSNLGLGWDAAEVAALIVAAVNDYDRLRTIEAAVLAAGPPPDALMDGSPAGQALRSWWLRYAPALRVALQGDKP